VPPHQHCIRLWILLDGLAQPPCSM
jgi:hypothetical protein